MRSFVHISFNVFRVFGPNLSSLWKQEEIFTTLDLMITVDHVDYCNNPSVQVMDQETPHPMEKIYVCILCFFRGMVSLAPHAKFAQQLKHYVA